MALPLFHIFYISPSRLLQPIKLPIKQKHFAQYGKNSFLSQQSFKSIEAGPRRNRPYKSIHLFFRSLILRTLDEFGGAGDESGQRLDLRRDDDLGRLAVCRLGKRLQSAQCDEGISGR